MTEILVCSGVKKSFDGKTEVLKGVDLAVRKGDFISILGASGSGKSTLLTILGGMDAPTEGKVLFEGKALSELKEKDLAKLRRTKVGFVFQFFNLAPYLTVEENIFLPIVLDGKSPSKYREKFTFLTDYLNGDTYFKIHYPEHNLVRCHTQFALVADIERKLEQMSAITAKAAALYKD